MTDEPVNGVYFLFERKKLIYIGKSRDCAKRVAAHRSNGRPFDYYLIMPVSVGEADWVEIALIKAMEPKQNKRGIDKVVPGKTIVGPAVVKPGPTIFKPVVVTYDPNDIYWLPDIKRELAGYLAHEFIARMKAGEIPGVYSESNGKKYWRCRAEEVFKWKRALQKKWGEAA